MSVWKPDLKKTLPDILNTHEHRLMTDVHKYDDAWLYQCVSATVDLMILTYFTAMCVKKVVLTFPIAQPYCAVIGN